MEALLRLATKRADAAGVAPASAGSGINHPGHLFETTPTGRPYVADCIARGARYLYSNDSTMLRDPRLQPYLKQQLLQEGAFGVWELRAPAPGQLQSARHAERSRSIFTALSGPIDVVYCHDSRCFYQLNSTAECQVQLLHSIYSLAYSDETHSNNSSDTLSQFIYP